MKEFRLDNEPKIASGFKVPNGYFESFSENLSKQLPEKEIEVISLFNRKKIWYFAAAAIVTVLLSIPVYNYYNQKTQEIDSATLENYIIYHSTVSEDEIVNLLDEEDLKEIKIELNIDDATIENVLYTNSNLEQYILN